jgi:transcriptional regulator with XRE-family HTH domain
MIDEIRNLPAFRPTTYSPHQLQKVNVDLGHRLKLFRVAASLKQPELAKRLGVSANYVYMVESGRREPSREYVQNFSKEVDIPLSVIYLEPSTARNAKSRKLLEKVLALLAEYAQATGVKKGQA